MLATAAWAGVSREGELGDPEPKHVLHRPAPCG